MRILDRSVVDLSLENVGMDESMMADFRKVRSIGPTELSWSPDRPEAARRRRCTRR